MIKAGLRSGHSDYRMEDRNNAQLTRILYLLGFMVRYNPVVRIGCKICIAYNLYVKLP